MKQAGYILVQSLWALQSIDPGGIILMISDPDYPSNARRLYVNFISILQILLLKILAFHFISAELKLKTDQPPVLLNTALHNSMNVAFAIIPMFCNLLIYTSSEKSLLILVCVSAGCGFMALRIGNLSFQLMKNVDKIRVARKETSAQLQQLALKFDLIAPIRTTSQISSFQAFCIRATCLVFLVSLISICTAVVALVPLLGTFNSGAQINYVSESLWVMDYYRYFQLIFQLVYSWWTFGEIFSTLKFSCTRDREYEKLLQQCHLIETGFNTATEKLVVIRY